RVVDVEQLHVEEDVLVVVAGQFAGEIEAAGEGELVANLVEGHGVAEIAHHRLGFLHRGHVEPDDEALAHGVGVHGSMRVETWRAACVSVRHRTSMDFNERSSRKLPASSKAALPSGTAHSGVTTSIWQRTRT